MSRFSLPGSRLCQIVLFASIALPLAAGAAEPTKASATPLKPQSVVASKPAPAGAAALDKREIRAQLLPRRYTTLAAEIGAKIRRLTVPEGGRFKAGEVLVRFDCSLQQAQLDKSRAALKAAEQTWQANKRLAELNSVGKLELNVSEAEAAKARAEVASNNTQLSKCVIAAPFAGRVAEQKAREQQFVQAGQPLLDILDDSALELEFIVPSKWLAWVRLGTGFQVIIDETGKNYPAKVQRMGARVDPVSQSVKLSAEIDGKFPELIAGMSGRVLMSPPGQ